MFISKMFPSVRRWAPYITFVIGALIVLTAWQRVNLDEGHDPIVTQVYFEARVRLLIGIVILWVAVLLFARQYNLAPQSFDFIPLPEKRPFYTSFWILSLAGAALILVMTFWVNPDYKFLGYHHTFTKSLSPYRQLAMYLGGMVLWVLGFMHLSDPLRIGRRVWTSCKTYPHEWILVSVLTLAALAFRLYKLDSGIPVMVSDESAYLVAGRRVMEQIPLNIAYDMHRGDLFLGAYMISLLMQVFGVSLFTGRLMVALVGALAIPGVYLMTRRLFNWRAAWLACMFLLTQPLHFHFSRIALYDIYDPTLATFAVLLMWDGMERGGRWKFALAGILIGFSQYYYAGARLWLILIPLWWGFMLLRQPAQIVKYWSSFLIMIVTVILVLAPMIVYFKVHHISPLAHAATMSQEDGAKIEGAFDIKPYDFVFVRLSRSLRAFIDLGDQTRHFEPWGKTQLNFRWALLLFVLGLVVYLRYPLNPGLLFLAMWLGMMVILGGAMMRDTPGFSRYVTAMLPMAMLAGIGTVWFLDQFRPLVPVKQQPYLLIVGVMLMILITVTNFQYLQRGFVENWMADMSPNRFISDAIAREATIVAQQGITPYFVFNDNPNMTDRLRLLESYEYYCGLCPYHEITVVDPYQDITPEWLSDLQSSEDVYLYILPGDRTPYDASPPGLNSPVYVIRSAYPNAEVDRFNSSEYKTLRQFALFTRVKIPGGTKISVRENSSS